MNIQSISSKAKAAEVLLSMPPQKAAQALKPLEEHEILWAGEAIMGHKNRTQQFQSLQAQQTAQDTLEQELAEDTHSNINDDPNNDTPILMKVSDNDESSLEIVKALYRLAFGKKKSETLIGKLLRKQLANKLSFLYSHTTNHIYQAIAKESPLIISTVLNVLPSTQSAEILQKFDTANQIAIMKCVVAQKHPTETALNIVHDILMRNLNTIAQEDQQTDQPDGETNLINILKHLPLEQQRFMMDGIDDKSMKERMQYQLFSWDMVFLLNKEEAINIMNEYTNQDIAKILLLDGKDAYCTLEKFISKNRLSLIDEELHILTEKLPQNPSLVQEAKTIKLQFFQGIQNIIQSSSVSA